MSGGEGNAGPNASPDVSDAGAEGNRETGRAGGVLTRRALLAGTVAGVGAALLTKVRRALARASSQAGGWPRPGQVRMLGRAPDAVGVRSPYVKLGRWVDVDFPAGWSMSPLQDLEGILTPSDLHFERHHAGVPEIDPADYELLIHGMVDRPMVFTLDDLKRFPARSRIHFIECSGNGSGGYFPDAMKPDLTPAQIDGLTSTSEWVGVPLATLFREAGVRPEARWFLAEGADAALMDRSIPVEKAWDDALIAYGQNGEPLRPEQGFPVRLLLPGWEGNTNVKWLRRIELSDRPFMTREETSKYTDPLGCCTARQFSFTMDAKSIITFPTYPVRLPGRGWWEVRGLAWSGRGRIARVDVSTNGGASWAAAELQAPVLPKSHTRFRYLWHWEGGESVLMSRAMDETGYVQPTLQDLRAARGPGTYYHTNNIRAWRVERDGRVVFGLPMAGRG